VTGVSGTTFTLRTASGAAVTATLVSFNPTTRVATFDPNGSLASDTRYTATLTDGVKDAAGNPLAATSWTFTTGPRPRVTANSPTGGATGVRRDANVTATFSEAVKGILATSTSTTSTTFRLRPVSESGGVGAPVAATVSRDGTTNRWILDPTAKLASRTRYRASLSSAITDLIGNPLRTFTWEFTTGTHA